MAGLVGSAAVGCQSNTPTPAGAEVLGWTKASSTFAGFASGNELGARTSKDEKLVITPGPPVQDPLSLRLHLETARVEFVSGQKAVQQTAPVALKVSVLENRSWTASSNCSPGLGFQMGPIKDGAMVTPEAMILQCWVKLHYKSTFKDLEYSLFVESYGDGRVVLSVANGKVDVSPL